MARQMAMTTELSWQVRLWRLSRAELEELLAKRIRQMQDGGADDAPTFQFRVYSYIIEQFERGDRPLRLMVQASAGTGKS